MPYIGKGANGFGIRERYRYSASGSQTAFTGSDLDSKTLQIDSGSLVDVYLNGVLLDTTDYNTNTANQVTLTSGATASDEVMIIVYDVFSLSDAMPKTGGTFSGDITLSSTDAGASSAPNLTLNRNSSSPATDDVMGKISFKGKNDADEEIEYVNIEAVIADETDGTEDGKIQIGIMRNGTVQTRFAMAGNSDTKFFNRNVQLSSVDFKARGNEIFLDSDDDTSITADTDDRIDFKTAGSDRMHLDGNGKVGIGGLPSVNLHIVEDATEGTPSYAGATHLAVQASASSGDNCNLAITAGSAGTCRIMFGDKDDEDEGKIEYNNDNGIMQLISGSVTSAKFSSGRVSLGEDASPNANAMVRCDTNESDEQAFTIHASNGSYATEAQNIFTTRTADTAFSYMKMHSNSNNDVEFNFRGDGQGFADGGTFNNPADYAEFFEWKDGNSSDEDRIGYSVILDGNKIVKATSSDDTSKIVGVISGNPVVVGDCAWNRWDGKFVKDDYNRYVREEYSITEWKDSEGKLIQYMTDEIPSDVTVPSDAKVTSTEVDGKTKLTRRKLNPDWDKSKTYIPREDRKEWDMVGMVGKLYLRKGQPTGDRWIKMRDISDTVEEWLVR